MGEQLLTNPDVSDAPPDRGGVDRAAVELERQAGVLGAMQGFLRRHSKSKRVPKARGRVGSLPLPFKRLSEQTGTA